MVDTNWAGTRESREKTLNDNCAFGIGDRVCVGELPDEMKHFNTSGKAGTITDRTLHTNNGVYEATYVVYLDGIGNNAWYPEATLLMLKGIE
jgi:hypothetical protein